MFAKQACRADIVTLGKSLFVSPRHVVRVCRYLPGESHSAHRDAYPRISLLLKGAYGEDGPGGSIRMAPGDVLLKSHRVVHEDRFGGGGAYVASVEFLDSDPFDLPDAQAEWRRLSDGFALRHCVALIEAALAQDDVAVEAAGNDLISGVADGVARPDAPPQWLGSLKEELEVHSIAQVDLRARAFAGGVHPVHASRLFRRHYGTTISDHANGQSIRRAWRLMVGTELGLSEIAVAAGFYDQSHMNRMFRRVLRQSPGAQRARLNALLG